MTVTNNTLNSPVVSEIVSLLNMGGTEQYGGEAVSQLGHALQCATLAEQHNESQPMIVACLLHDIGHLLYHLGDEAYTKNIDDTHENLGADFLKPHFGPAITEPIRLHVPAKRYLCQVDKNYWATLSPVSKKTLELQGGIFSPEQAEEFIALPYARAAVQLRIWDDEAKVKGLSTPDLAHFTKIIEACLMT